MKYAHGFVFDLGVRLSLWLPCCGSTLRASCLCITPVGNAFYIPLNGRVAVYHRPHHLASPVAQPRSPLAGSSSPSNSAYATTGSAGLRLLANREAVVGALVGYTRNSAVGLLSCTGELERLHSAVVMSNASPSEAHSSLMTREMLGERHTDPILDMEPVAADEAHDTPQTLPGETLLLQVDGRSTAMRTVCVCVWCCGCVVNLLLVMGRRERNPGHVWWRGCG